MMMKKRKNRKNSMGGGGRSIVATSNRADDVDPCFRRGGRLEKEIDVIGSKKDRSALVSTLLQKYLLQQQCDVSLCESDIHMASQIVGERTGGYVSADLVALVEEGCKHIEVNPSSQTNKQASTSSGSSPCTMSPWTEHLVSCLDKAALVVSPSCLRGVAIKLPELNYSDVIGYDDIKDSLRRILSFSSPLLAAKTKRFGLRAPGGGLLYGPPGNSKTRLVMAAAAHHGLPVISLSSADVYSPYVGDAEAEIRRAFRIAQQASPCVLFMDEIDAIVTNRSDGGSSGSGSGGGVSVEARVLSTLLNEMDGIGGERGVIVLGATNRIEAIDAALLRKGRFHHLLHVPSPDETTRMALLDYFANKCNLPLERVEELKRLELKEGISGAEVENVCREEAMRVLSAKLSLIQQQQSDRK